MQIYEELKARGYNPRNYYNNNPIIRQAIDQLNTGIGGKQFTEIANSLMYSDPYMVLADFNSYREAQLKIQKLYQDKYTWNKMSLRNIAQSGIFCADRSIQDYARTIWNLDD